MVRRSQPCLPARAGARTLLGFIATTLIAAASPAAVQARPLFASPFVAYECGYYPHTAVIADFNGDGHPDLAVASNDGAVSVLMNRGDGTFWPRLSLSAGATPSGLAVADLNSDHHLDLVATNSGGNTVSVFLGDGIGGFGTKTDFTTGTGPSAVAIGDLNGDTRPDLVVANNSAATVSVLLGNGLGGFGTKTDYSTGTLPNSVALGDLNGDSRLDMIVGTAGASTFTVRLGTGTGTFGARNDRPTGGAPNCVCAGDINGDHLLDVVTAGPTAISVLPPPISMKKTFLFPIWMPLTTPKYIRRASSRPEITRTSSHASCRIWWRSSFWFDASRVAEVATATNSSEWKVRASSVNFFVTMTARSIACGMISSSSNSPSPSRTCCFCRVRIV